MFLSDSYAFYRKYLHDMATEQALDALKAMDGIFEETESGKITAKAGAYEITYTLIARYRGRLLLIILIGK